MKPTKRDIIACVVGAQICSDAGKGFFNLKVSDRHLQKLCEKAEYKMKSYLILRAIDKIRCTPFMGIRYYCECWKLCSVIVYFMVDGEQISFHCPYLPCSGEEEYVRRLRCIAENQKPSKRIRWNKKRGGSLETAEHLIAEYSL